MEFFFFQLFLFLIALFSNSLSAFAGGGAGLIQLPMLILLGLPFSVALATHKLASVSLGVGASLRHFKEKSLQPSLAISILASGLPGVILGAKAALTIPESFSLVLLGLLTLSVACYSIKNSKFGMIEKPVILNKSNLIIGCVVLFVLGFLNGSFSSGTGLFVTLWLVRWFQLSYTKSVAYTLILVGLFWNGAGAVVLGLNGQIQWRWLPMLFAGSLVGGYLGAHFSLLKGNRLVKSIFEFVSLFVGISLLARALF
tara:strand:- start:38 stop:805 length:768 start_codon:yes stop_codon:yes gene_type:complete